MSTGQNEAGWSLNPSKGECMSELCACDKPMRRTSTKLRSNLLNSIAPNKTSEMKAEPYSIRPTKNGKTYIYTKCLIMVQKKMSVGSTQPNWRNSRWNQGKVSLTTTTFHKKQTGTNWLTYADKEIESFFVLCKQKCEFHERPFQDLSGENYQEDEVDTLHFTNMPEDTPEHDHLFIHHHPQLFWWAPISGFTPRSQFVEGKQIARFK